MNLFYVTFGAKSPFLDFFIKVYADNEKDAFKVAESEFKNLAFVYKESEWNAEDPCINFPLGCMCVLYKNKSGYYYAKKF